MHRVLMCDAAAIYTILNIRFGSNPTNVSGYSSTENKCLCQTRHTLTPETRSVAQNRGVFTDHFKYRWIRYLRFVSFLENTELKSCSRF